MKLWQKVCIGIFLGVISGQVLHNHHQILEIFNIGGQMFMRLIRMLMGPLIFCVLCSGILNVSNTKSFGATGFKIISLSLFNTCFSVIMGIFIANWIQPGKNFNMDLLNKTTVAASSNAPSLKSAKFDIAGFLCNFIPENVFQSFTNANLLQIVFFAIFTGIICQVYKKHYFNVKNKINVVSDVLFYMMERIMLLSPYGAFCLMAYAIGIQGVDIIFALGRLIVSLLLTMLIQYFIFGISIFILCRKSPIPFYRKSFSYQILAFSISSSKLVLPKTIKICKNSLGISDFSARVSLPIASAFNITGSGMQLGICAIFFSQIYNVDLSAYHYFYIIFLSTIGAIGAAGVPGLSLLMLPIVLNAISVPSEGVALLLGIDRILDMLRTTLNITGDVSTTLIVDASEKKMNYETYYK